MMIWVFAALALVGFVPAVPFWKGDAGTAVTGGWMANFLGIPLVKQSSAIPLFLCDAQHTPQLTMW